MSSGLDHVEILYEDERYLVLNKLAGKHSDELLTHSTKWQLVHRLDLETTGCLLFCLPELVAPVRNLFRTKNESLEKLYLAGASAALPFQYSSETRFQPVNGFIGARHRSSKKVQFAEDKSRLKGFHGFQPASHSLRRAKPEERPTNWTGEVYVVRLESGARHQIRSWFCSQKAPLVGDVLYGGPTSARVELHAWKLSWTDPAQPSRRIEVQAPTSP